MRNSVFSGIGWSFAERVSAQVVSLVVSIILARLLHPEEYGVLAIVNVFVAIGDALVAGGFGTALVQKIDSDERDFNTICWFSVFISFILYIILFLCAPFISRFYNIDNYHLLFSADSLEHEENWDRVDFGGDKELALQIEMFEVALKLASKL